MTQTAYATSISDLQKQRQEKENQKKGTQSQLDSVNDQINDLSGEKDDVDAQISELTGQIAEIMASVSLLEDEIADTQVQIEQAQKDYDEAKAKEEAQYHAMKKRIQYLYEKGETSYLELLMEAKSWADMLNKAEYVQEIYTYDRKMLDNYAATVQEVAQLKESLEEQKSELEASEYELEQEKDSLQVSLDEQKELAADYEVQLAKAKQEAAAYKAKIKQQNAEIQKLASQEAARKAEDPTKTPRSTRRAELWRQSAPSMISIARLTSCIAKPRGAWDSLIALSISCTHSSTKMASRRSSCASSDSLRSKRRTRLSSVWSTKA